MRILIEKYCELPTVVRRPMWRIWHNLITRFDKDNEAVFLNYGYQYPNEGKKLQLEPGDEKNRYCIQLYDYAVSSLDMKDKDVLEVGSGRGGGASYITRYYNPKSYTAMDISSGVVGFCNNYHKVDNLKFIKGVAEEIPFTDNSFNVVVNVESARCYRSLQTFFNEVQRVLRPGGFFCFADMIKKGEVESIKKILLASNLEIVSQTNITANVVDALNKDHERRQAMIDKKTPRFLRKSFMQFAGTKGTERYEAFVSGRMEYWDFVLTKS